ncbi:MAG: DUF4349 domain-containing protein, partial [Actinomycetota bacterium]|nr:DUF4349 domain-containing protein [Actinomycetota bacterium]
GTVTDLNVSTDDGEPVYRYAETPLDGAPLSGYLTVRIPADALDAFLEDVARVGTVLREAENQSDVTQEHIDLKARLTNLEATEARLRDFIEQAKNVTEMLAVEQELSRVRGDIESMRAQIAYLERQAAHSTVTIELTGPKPIVRPGGQDWGFSAALTESVRAFVGTINGLIVFVGAFAPLLVLALVAWLIIRSVVRRTRRRREAAATHQVADTAGIDDGQVSNTP